MKSKFSVLSLLLLVLFVTRTSFAAELAANLGDRAVSENTAESAAAIEELRALGPTGLQTLMARYADEIKNHIDNPTLKPDAEWQRITKALDAVSGQKNSYVSGLYWYTDLNEAQKVANQTHKPILSLRLLGRLTDELSCANSRFFRTVLYSNAEIASVLRERFVLHWQSERPAPVITIDFGDGRKLERTVTGNSIHYVLDSSGAPIDAFPGLYGPQAFLRGLKEAEQMFSATSSLRDLNRLFVLRNFHRSHNYNTSLAWLTDIAKIGGKVPEGVTVVKGPHGEYRAIEVAPAAVTKMITEQTILRQMQGATEALGRVTDEDAWRKIAQLHAADAVLDGRSIGLIRRQNPSLSEQEFAAMLKNFQQLVALDTVRNEYLMHAKLAVWLSQNPTSTDLEKLNEKVYAELFLTPKSDPWLGLLDKDVYVGIDNSGVK
jgi:hypothetical protein